MNDALFQAAKHVRQKAYAPYSKFLVGAAILGKNGRIYVGCNIENQSYPEGWCAETAALSHMIVDGEREIAAVCVIGTGDVLCTPCGGCRQRLAEFGAPDVPVYIAKDTGLVATYQLGELLPAAFELEG